MRLVFFAALWAAFSCPAHAQRVWIDPAACLPQAEMVHHLATRYAEHRHAMAVTAAGRVLETFVSDAGTWTIAITDPNGTACVITHGDGWQRVAPDNKDPAS